MQSISTIRRKNSKKEETGTIKTEKTNDLASLLSQSGDGRIEIDKLDADSNAACKFNGYSNKEILIMFLTALITNLFFFFKQSQYIYGVFILFDDKKLNFHITYFNFIL